MKYSVTMTLMLLFALPACGDDTDDTDTDSASSATGASTSGVTDGTATDTTVDPTAADTTAADTTAADTTAADTTAADTTAADTTAAETTMVDPTTGGGLSFAVDVWEPILVSQCGCHQVGASGGLLMGMDAASAYASMVNVPSMNGMNHVTPGDPDNSYLFHKVAGTQVEAGGGGSTMPLGAPALTQGQIDTIAAWIADGANQ